MWGLCHESVLLVDTKLHVECHHYLQGCGGQDEGAGKTVRFLKYYTDRKKLKEMPLPAD
jgi:hypothetical protein